MEKRKEYQKPFQLDEGKLTSLVGVLREQLTEDKFGDYAERYEVFYKSNTHDELHSLESVFALENSRRLPIERLLITATSRSDAEPTRQRTVQVDFATDATVGDPNNRKNKVIAVHVTSEPGRWASQTLAAVEQQVERTWQSVLPPTITLVILAIVSLVILAGQFLSWSNNPIGANAMWLTKAELQNYQVRLKDHQPLSDQEMRELTTRQLHNVIDDQLAKSSLSAGSQKKRAWITYPILVVILCAMGLMWKGYPAAVFYWRDAIERQQQVLFWRKALWSVIIAITVTGLLGNMLSNGLMAGP